MPVIEFPDVQWFDLRGKFECPVLLRFCYDALEASAGFLHDVVASNSLEFGGGSSARTWFEGDVFELEFGVVIGDQC